MHLPADAQVSVVVVRGRHLGLHVARGGDAETGRSPPGRESVEVTAAPVAGLRILHLIELGYAAAQRELGAVGGEDRGGLGDRELGLLDVDRQASLELAHAHLHDFGVSDPGGTLAVNGQFDFYPPGFGMRWRLIRNTRGNTGSSGRMEASAGWRRAPAS